MWDTFELRQDGSGKFDGKFCLNGDCLKNVNLYMLKGDVIHG